MKNYNSLIQEAIKAQRSSYAPYSGYNVGSALLTKGGSIYTGCNIENSSYGATVCAERVAFGNAMSNSEREFSAIAIVGGRDFSHDEYAFPCGICIQVMSELCNDDFEIVLCGGESVKVYKLSELLPHRFVL